VAGCVLIIEDDRELQELYSEMLRDVGCDIVPAYDGGEALEKLKEFRPDLIILDLLLDEVAGDTVFEAVKGDSIHKDIPVIVASVLSLERCQHLLDLDPTTLFLRKPFRKEELVDAVKGALAQGQAQRSWHEIVAGRFDRTRVPMVNYPRMEKRSKRR
jgi:CheY-like chemotaxis protein